MTYEKAARTQYTDNEMFEKLLDESIPPLEKYLNSFEDSIEYAKKCYELLGLEKGSIMRLEKTKSNIGRLIDFIEQLKANYRPLPAINSMSIWLFESPKTIYWAARCDEWYDENTKFVNCDVENSTAKSQGVRRW